MPFSKDLLIGSSGNQGAGDFYEYQITRSLRLPGDADNGTGVAYLSRTQPSGAAADGTKETVSFWFKNSFAPADANANQDGVIMTRYDGTSPYEALNINHYNPDYSNFTVTNKSSYHRFDTKSSDQGTWCHFCMVVNTSDSTAGDRHKFYLNGTRITDFETETTATSGAVAGSGYSYNSSNATIKVGGNASGAAGFFTGYLAEFVYVSDNNYAISNFGETKSGVWVPKDVSGLTFGAKGFYLKFVDSNYTVDTAGVGNFSSTGLNATDSMTDTPTFDSDGQAGCFANLMGSLSANKMSEGNLKITGDGGNFDNTYSSFSFDAEDTEGWYWEWRVGSSDGSTAYGIAKHERNDYMNTANPTYGFYYDSDAGYALQADGNKRNGSTNSSYGTASTTAGSIVMLAVKGGKFFTGVNGTWHNSGNPATGTNFMYENITGFWSPSFAMNGTHNGIVNFGADSTFDGAVTAGTYSDANGYGSFKYEVPSGFKALCSANLSVGTGVDPAEGKNGTFHCDTGIYSGTGTAQNITGLNFQPDLVWVSQRTTNTTANNYVFDSTRGVNKYLLTNESNAQSTDADTLTAFNSDGFSIGSDSNTNNSTDNYSFLAWKAGGGTTSTNNDGTVASTVQVNSDAGFSIVKYTGTGSSMTVGHGLSAQPSLVIVKDIDNSVNWIVYSKDFNGSNDYAFLNTNAAWSDSGLAGAGASVITFDSASSYSNTSSRDYIMYCWREIAGYSKFGFYHANANADGPFIYTGFRPQALLLKKQSGSDDWGLYTQAINPTGNVPSPNLQRIESTNGEQGGTGRKLDFMGNGFKLYTSNSTFNSGDFFYAAWGDIPHKYGNTYI